MALEPPKSKIAVSADAYAAGCFVCGLGGDGSEDNKPRTYKAGPGDAGLLVHMDCFDRRMALVRKGVISNWWESPERAEELRKEEEEAAKEKAEKESSTSPTELEYGKTAIQVKQVTGHDRAARWGEKEPETISATLPLPTQVFDDKVEWEIRGSEGFKVTRRLGSQYAGSEITIEATAIFNLNTGSEIARSILAAVLYGS